MKSFIKNIYPYDFLVAGYLLSALILSALTGMKIDYSVIFQSAYDLTFITIVLLYLIIFLAIIALDCRRSAGDTFIFGPCWRKRAFSEYLTLRNLADLLRVLILLKATLLIYCNIKQAIPSLHHALFDEELLKADSLLFFGFNPNTVAVSLLGNDITAPLFDRLYIFWYMLKPLVLAYFAIIPDRRMHIRFFTAYFAMWIFGGLAAVIIPSLGPVYTHPEWFSSMHIRFAPALQGKLMKHYEASLLDPEKYRIYIYEGIAAFPSLHVGIIALFAFFMFKVSRKAGIAMIIYTAIVQIGSVLLGWHYAVDGYAAILLATLLYYASEFIYGRE